MSFLDNKHCPVKASTGPLYRRINAADKGMSRQSSAPIRRRR